MYWIHVYIFPADSPVTGHDYGVGTSVVSSVQQTPKAIDNATLSTKVVHLEEKQEQMEHLAKAGRVR